MHELVWKISHTKPPANSDLLIIMTNVIPSPSPTASAFVPSARNDSGPRQIKTAFGWRLWEADIHVWMASKGLGNHIHSPELWEVFLDDAEYERVYWDRKAKAMLWFSVASNLREQHLLDLCHRDATSYDVYVRIRERLGPQPWWKRIWRLYISLFNLEYGLYWVLGGLIFFAFYRPTF